MKNIEHITAMESMLRESLASIAITITCTRTVKSAARSSISARRATIGQKPALTVIASRANALKGTLR